MDTMKIYRLSSVCFAVLCRKNADKVVQNISHDLKMHGRIVFAVKLHELHTDSVTRMLSAPSVDFILFIKCQIICVATILTINIVSTLTTMQAITFRIVAHQTSNIKRITTFLLLLIFVSICLKCQSGEFIYRMGHMCKNLARGLMNECSHLYCASTDILNLLSLSRIKF